jgi:proton-translocating NADH-quinone oxidoreductase chain L
MYLLIVGLPLLSAAFAGLGGAVVGRQGAQRLSVACLFVTWLMSVTAFYEVGFAGGACTISLAPWVVTSHFEIGWGFLFDSLTVTMLVVVTTVSTLVHLYSIGYMGEDPHVPRFMSYLSLFTFFMLILVTADNLLQMFVGWEGVGLCSYLLINFWFARLQANKAAIKAMLVNRVGDFGLVLGMLVIFVKCGSLDYGVIFAMAPHISTEPIFCGLDALTVGALLLFVGATGKSAQIGLHTWLPDAMEGPTPVSALIHAATMVTAGIFLLARMSPMLEWAPTALGVVAVAGAATAFFAATTGVVQNDLKRVIAYSTCSQLGYMCFACGVSSYTTGVFHLANHAFFKALLFLSAGSVIHALADEQDMRRMGGLVRALPFTYAMMAIGSLSLMGLPFFTGFYSKDAILESAAATFGVPGTFAYCLGAAAAFATAFYSMRLLALGFLTGPNGFRRHLEGVHESPLSMLLPLGILAVGSVIVGFVGKDFAIGAGSDFWGAAIFVHPAHAASVDAEWMPHMVKVAPVLAGMAGASLGFLLYQSSAPSQLRWTLARPKVYGFFNRKWLFDKVINEWVAAPALHHGYWSSFKAIDRGLIEMAGPYGLLRLLYSAPTATHRWSSGFLYHILFAILVGLSLFLLGAATLGAGALGDVRVLLLLAAMVVAA